MSSSQLDFFEELDGIKVTIDEIENAKQVFNEQMQEMEQELQESEEVTLLELRRLDEINKQSEMNELAM